MAIDPLADCGSVNVKLRVVFWAKESTMNHQMLLGQILKAIKKRPTVILDRQKLAREEQGITDSDTFNKMIFANSLYFALEFTSKILLMPPEPCEIDDCQPKNYEICAV